MDRILLVANFLFVSAIFGGLLVATHARLSGRFYFLFYLCFFATYYLFHVLAKKYAARIGRLSPFLFCVELPAFLFAGCYVFYAFNVLILEGIAYLTDNFWDGISCRGPGCVVFFGILMYIPYLVFVILNIILFTPILYGVERAAPVKNVGFFSLRLVAFRIFCYVCLGVCSLVVVFFLIRQIKM